MRSAKANASALGTSREHRGEQARGSALRKRPESREERGAAATLERHSPDKNKSEAIFRSVAGLRSGCPIMSRGVVSVAP